MQTSLRGPSADPAALSDTPEAAEDALMSTLTLLGRRLRQRHPLDTLDFAVVPILRALQILGAMRLTALAEVLHLDASTVSRHVKQLEERGYLQRTSDPDDARASQIQLSGAGAIALTGHLDRRRAQISSILGRWSPQDREELRSLINRFNDDMSREVTPS